MTLDILICGDCAVSSKKNLQFNTSEQELHFSAADTGKPPVVICLPENIRIEVDADCPARLMASLLQVLKSHA